MAEDSALTRFANSEIHQNVAETNVTDQPARRRREAGRGRLVRPDRRRRACAGSPRTPPRSPGSWRSSTTGAACPGPTEIRDVPAALQPGDRRGKPGIPRRGRPGGHRRRGRRRRDRLRLVRDRHRIDRGRQLEGRSRVRDADDVAAHHGLDGCRAAEAATPRRPRSTPSTIDAAALGREAAGKARATADAVSIEPGDYPVVLEEYAVVDLLDMLGYLGFSALAVQEERSFFEPGKRIGSDLVTIVDDGYDPTGPARSGSTTRASPSSASSSSSAAICRDVVYDAQTARPRRRRRRPATACRPRTRTGRSP